MHSITFRAFHPSRSFTVLFFSMTSLLVTLVTNGASWIIEDFSYEDGPLIRQGAPLWVHTSGTEEQILVQNGQLLLDEDDSEDIMLRLSQTAGEPINQADPVFVSFDLLVEALPSGEGNYFAHFRGSSSSTYRGRLFLIPDTDQDKPHYRLGVSNGSSAAANAVHHPDSIPISETCTVVMRFTPGDPSTQLWINPNTEMSASVGADDSPTAKTIEAFAFRQSQSNGNGSGTLSIDNLIVGSTFEDVTAHSPQTASPTLEEPIDPTPSPPHATPHIIKVNPSNEFILQADTDAVQITFSRSTGLEIPLDLSIKAKSTLGSQSEILELPTTIQFESMASSAGWTIRLSGNRPVRPSKVIELQIEPSEPTFQLEQESIILSVLGNDPDSPLISDSFDRPDQPLNRDPRWRTHSGAPGITSLSDARLSLSHTRTEDLNLIIPGSPYRPEEDLSLYIGFDLTILETQPPGETYFAHLKGESNTAFRSRIYLRPQEGNETRVQIGILAGAHDAPVYHPDSLDLFRPYRIIMTHELASGVSGLRINAVEDSGDQIQSLSSSGPIAIEAFAFRQTGSRSGNRNDLQIDNLDIGTTFTSVAGTIPTLPEIEIPENTPPPSSVTDPAPNVHIRIRRESLEIDLPLENQYRLQQSNDLILWTTIQTITGGNNPVSIPLDTNLQSEQFFRVLAGEVGDE